MSFKERIKTLIESEGIKQVEFANKLNVDASYISKLLSNKSNTLPSERLLDDICRKFNVNKEWLIDGTGDMYNKLSAEEEFAFLMGTLAASDNPQLKALINVLSQIDNEEDLDLILNLCKRLAANKED